MSLDQEMPIHWLIREIDYGTPQSNAVKKVALAIDGKQISVPEGTSVMRAAMEAAIEIPKLCATDMLDAFGSCRLCLIEIEGRAGTPASCTTPVAEGMVVRTKSERLDRLRKGIMELYVSDHPVDSLDRTKYADIDLLEPAFWYWLRIIAAECGMTAKKFIECIRIAHPNDPLSSTLRVQITNYFYSQLPRTGFVDPESKFAFRIERPRKSRKRKQSP